MPRNCLSFPLYKGLGVFRNHSSKLCLNENDSTCFCSSLSMLGVKGKAEFPSFGYLCWQFIILLFSKHLQRHFNQSWNAALLLLYGQCISSVVCTSISVLALCVLFKRWTILKTFLYCIIYSLEFKIIIREHGYVGLLRWGWWYGVQYIKWRIQLWFYVWGFF